jgi:hypothetical protein
MKLSTALMYLSIKLLWSSGQSKEESGCAEETMETHHTQAERCDGLSGPGIRHSSEEPQRRHQHHPLTT